MAEALKAALSIAIFIILTSGIMVILQPPNSAGFVISVLSLVIGVIFLAIAIFIIRRMPH